MNTFKEKTLRGSLLLAALTCLLVACKDNDPSPQEEEEPKRVTSDEIYYANRFASDVLSDVYLWEKEIKEEMKRLDPDTNLDPISTVKEIRYKENGAEVDKWTMLTDDVAALTNSNQGVSTTYGYKLALGKFSNSDNYFFLVNMVFDYSPAAQAGLKRGDILLKINGQNITKENYLEAVNSSSITLTLGEKQGNSIGISSQTVTMQAKQMYCNPILCAKTFEADGKQIGYLAYESFDLESVEALISICKEFKALKVEELILDLRYNGGGYVFTELALASMLAPEAEVKSHALYQTEVWNDSYMEYYKSKGIDLNTYFYNSLKMTTGGKTYTAQTADANIGIKKLYVLVGSSTASASESLVVGLLPFLPIELIGSQTHGKYCTGMVLTADDVYDKKIEALDNWGIYVMINRYADRNGNCPCMPNGLTPDYEVKDNAMEGYLLGDERESLLRMALQHAGMSNLPATRSLPDAIDYEVCEQLSQNPLEGKRIALQRP